MSQLVNRGVAELPAARVAGSRRTTRTRRPGLQLANGRLKPLLRLARDPYLVYTALLAPVALAVGWVTFFTQEMGLVVALSAVFIGLQAVAGLVPTRHRFLTPQGWTFLRLAIALLYARCSRSTSRSSRPRRPSAPPRRS
jgi:hypothetical protein